MSGQNPESRLRCRWPCSTPFTDDSADYGTHVKFTRAHVDRCLEDNLACRSLTKVQLTESRQAHAMHVPMQHDRHKQWQRLEAVMSEEDTVLTLIPVGHYFSQNGWDTHMLVS